MFALDGKEAAALRSQSVTLEKGRGRYAKYLPHAFTEQGVAMLSSVLNSEQAIQVNIAIMRAFARLRGILASHKDLAKRLEAIRQLAEPPPGQKASAPLWGERYSCGFSTERLMTSWS